ncbi:hypothetical protein R0K04_26765, partial [Pseudoalteromonas sp. SIMBA_153]
MSDVTRNTISEKLTQKNRLLEEHSKAKPEEVSEPTIESSAEQQQVSAELTDVNRQLEAIYIQQEENKIKQ